LKIHTEEEKHHYEEVKKTHKIILSKQEYKHWKNIWLDALGWSHEYPHTTNLHKIILRGNYKWHPFTDVELEIELEGYEDKAKGKIRVSKVR
jgi:hypothetical protein